MPMFGKLINVRERYGKLQYVTGCCVVLQDVTGMDGWQYDAMGGYEMFYGNTGCYWLLCKATGI